MTSPTLVQPANAAPASAAQARRDAHALREINRHACQGEIREYLDRSGFDVQDFAHAMGYSKSTLAGFLSERYELKNGDSSALVAAARSYIAANPAGARAPQPVAGEVVETADFQLVRDAIGQLLESPRAFVMYAAPGTGKTFLVKNEIYRRSQAEDAAHPNAPRAFYVYCREGISPHDLLRRIAESCGTRMNGGIDRILRDLRHEHGGKRRMVGLDEAQNLSLPCLGVVRELLDEHGISLLFAGSHTLFQTFDRLSASLEQWNSRLPYKFRLAGCSRAEALAIVWRNFGDILDDPDAAGRKKTPEQIAGELVDRATVADKYTPAAPGQPAAEYINLRRLTDALRDSRTKYAEARKESAA